MKGYAVFCDEPFSSVKIKITEFCTVFNIYFRILVSHSKIKNPATLSTQTTQNKFLEMEY